MDFKNPETILIVQIGKIGDMVLTTPLFPELKRLFPNSSLTVLANDINKDIPLNHESVNNVLVFRKNIFKNKDLLKYVFLNTDIWIDTKDNFSKTGKLLLKLFRPKFSMGFLFSEDKVSFDVYLNKYVNGKHAVNLNLSPVNYFDDSLINSITLPSIHIPDNIRVRFNDVFEKEIKTKILINISAGNKNRYVSKEKWVELLNKFIGNESNRFYITGIEDDRNLIDFVINNTLLSNLKHIPVKNVLETAEIVRRSDLVITPDTSVVHICSAFNKPIVAIYPDVIWNYQKFKPLSEIKEVIFSKNGNSFEDVTSEELFEAAEIILKRISSGNAESRTRVRKEDH